MEVGLKRVNLKPRVFPATELEHIQERRIFYNSFGIKNYSDKTVYHTALGFDKGANVLYPNH